MSGLGSLFSGMSADNNDALKYSAPKEPKPARAAKPGAVSVSERVTAPTVAASVAVPVPVAKAPGPSKIMASAAVRMFKVNPSTGAYDAVDGGGLLGCVMMGTGLTFQILVYNGQKVPQATVAISGTFDYTLRDLYMSFADSAGNQWSLLFDSVEVMTIFVRTVVATIVHCATHNPDTVDSTTTIRRALPRIQPSEDEDSNTLALGMSAGVYLTAWEIMELADYPGDVVAGAPLKRVQAPEDVIKIKLSSTEELVGGLSDALVGLTKGDRVLIGVPPKIFYTSSSDGPLDLTKRAFPGSWVLLEVEVNKMKSSSEKKSKDKREDKKEDKVVKNTVPFESAPIDDDIDTTVHTSHNSNNNNNTNNTNNNNNELAARMARVAQQGNGGGANSQLAGIMSSQRSPGSGNSGDFQRKSFNSGSNNTNNNSGNNGGGNNDNRSYNNNNNNNNQDRQQSNDRYRSNNDDDRHYHNNNNGNNNISNNNYNNHRNYNNDDRQRSYHNHNNNNNNGYQENRLAVIEGQGARSYYDAEDDGNHHNGDNFGHNQNNNRYSNHNNSNRGAPPASANAPIAIPAPAASAADSALTASGLIQLHQSVAAVQQSMLQLHTKLDQVGTQVTNSAALQQQQLVATSTAGGAGTLSAGAIGMPGMNNPYMSMTNNPLQQQQMQFQLLQQQQQQQMMMGGYHMPVTNTMAMGAAPGGAASVQRIKTDELVSSLQALLVEYEKNSNSGGSGGGGGADVAAAKEEAKAAAKALRATIEKLEEKNDTLQTRYDKLMAEKSDLMEKYMEQFQTGSAATNKLYQSQQQLESAKEQTLSLQKEVDTLRASLFQAQQAGAASNSNSAGLSKEKEQEQKALIAELQHQVMSLQMEVMEAKQALQQSQGASSDLQALQAQHAQQTQELITARAESATLRETVETLQQAQRAAEQRVTEVTAEHAAAQAKISELQAALETAGNNSTSCGEAELVQQLQSQVTDLTSKLTAAESTSVSLNQALDSVAATAQATNDRTAETIADLERQLTAALANAAAEPGAANGKADAEELKSIMQDVYLKACEVFDPEAEDSGEAQYSTQDIVKRLRAVLKRVTTDRNSA